MSDIQTLKAKIIEFIRVDIWRIRLKDLSRTKCFFVKQLRILILTIRGFAKDKCSLSASALTFYSILSIVPVLAMAFGIAKGFGFQMLLEKQLLEKFQGQEEVMNRVVAFARSLLENTKGGMIASIGVLFLLWTVIKLLSQIERSFNDIWAVKVPPHLWAKIQRLSFDHADLSHPLYPLQQCYGIYNHTDYGNHPKSRADRNVQSGHIFHAEIYTVWFNMDPFDIYVPTHAQYQGKF